MLIAVETAIILGLVAAASAVTNWWSRTGSHPTAERWSKPLTIAALIGVAVLAPAAGTAYGRWLIVGLIASAAGDVLLLSERRFVPGLAAFLLAHLAYTAGFVARPEWRWWAAVTAAVIMTAAIGLVGRPIVAGATGHDPTLPVAVAAYLVVIAVMAVTAAAAGPPAAVAGAALFVISDALLGWNRFVTARSWMPPAVMITYHGAQALLVVSLYRAG
ncbi:MAG: lysoplasmalogenase family protein [Acidimicrobiales bacterium]